MRTTFFRLFSGIAGVFLMILVFTSYELLLEFARWPESPIFGALGASAVMLSVYLIFYSLTGDWLPRLSKKKGAAEERTRRTAGS